MSKLAVFYSRADENYFGGSYRYTDVGNTEKIAKMIAEKIGSEMFKIEQKTPYSKCPAGRPGTADEVANVAELLMSEKGAFITGTDFMCDGKLLLRRFTARLN